PSVAFRRGNGKVVAALLVDLVPGGLAPYNRKNEVFLPEIAAATANADAIDSKTAAKLMAAVQRPQKTNAAFLEAFAVGVGGGETVTLRATTCFDLASLDAAEIDGSFLHQPIAKEWLRELGVGDVDSAWLASKH